MSDVRTSLRRPSTQFALAWAVALALFVLINRDPGLRGGTGANGQDYFCSGHLMLLASSYLHAGFAIPLMMPTEDPYGPVGTWAPYCGWPPLFTLSLAAFLKVFGSSEGHHP